MLITHLVTSVCVTNINKDGKKKPWKERQTIIFLSLLREKREHIIGKFSGVVSEEFVAVFV